MKIFKPGKDGILYVSGIRFPAGFFVSFCLNYKMRIRLIVKGFEENRGQFLREPDPGSALVIMRVSALCPILSTPP